ncbi:MAG: GNAT family N-acetyltransferase [Candidatus Heimdallarchaeota archaeon]|nr:MAG: GNAT family N-acetyltransferase [Candidatus Heimdallarchaeota archaeon]
MMIKIPEEKVSQYHSFFDNCDKARNIIDTLTFHPVGNLYIDEEENPTILMYSLPWIHIFAGNPSSATVKEFFSKIKAGNLIFAENSWIPEIKEFWGNKLHSFTRTHFSPTNLDLHHIQKLKEKPLPDGFSIMHINRETIEFIEENLTNYFSLMYGSIDKFLSEGVGFCIKEEDKLASFATSFLPFKQNVEIQVITLEEYRRRGFATIICAVLIEFCLNNGLTPDWDAENELSVKLALRLGYTNPNSYKCYFWR